MSIPRRPAELTPQWLSSVLGVDVRTVDTEPIGTGQTGATYRVTVGYVDPARPGTTFAVKLSAQDDAVRDRVALGYRSEHAFYTQLTDVVKAPIPEHYYCDISSDGADFVLVLADLAPAVQGDQLGGCGAVAAELAVRAIAGLHAPTWCNPTFANYPGLVMSMPDAAAAKGLGDVAVMAAELTLDRLGAGLIAQDHETTTASMALVSRWLLAEPERFSLIHGDYRLDNLLFDPDETRVTIVDWQTLGAGLPARDLAYFTATSLLPDVRANLDEQLVTAYHDQLLSYGVTGYDWDSCWRDYRIGMLQAPLLTTLGCAFATTTERGDEMMQIMLARGCQAIRELGSLELVSAL